MRDLLLRRLAAFGAAFGVCAALAACQQPANNGVSSGKASSTTYLSTASVSPTKTDGTVTSVATSSGTARSSSSTSVGLVGGEAITAGALNQAAPGSCGSSSATNSTATGTRSVDASSLAVPTPPASNVIATSTPRFGAKSRASGTTSGSSSAAAGANASATLATTSPLGSPAFRQYESACSVDQLTTFFQDTLLHRGWTGGFDTPSTSPLASVTQSTTSSAAPGSPAYSASAPRVGAFIGVNQSEALTLFVTIQAAASPGGAPGAATTVEVVEQRFAR